MDTETDINFSRIEKAIAYLHEHYRRHPSLDEVAGHVHLSPYHFQRLFTDWAGVSPKKFVQFLTVEHAKDVLSGKESTLFDAAHQSGLSGTGRLHDLFVRIEGMTPGEYKNGGRKLSICYDQYPSPFGEVLVANTEVGICYMSFDEEGAADQLRAQFPNATITRQSHELQQKAVQIFTGDPDRLEEVKLHLKGTPFQLKVWNALLRIPTGNLSSYGKLASDINQPSASRAVGSAIGKNPIAWLIPCHRVIQSSGRFGGYRWGSPRKAAMIGWEAAKIEAFWQQSLDRLESVLKESESKNQQS